MRKMRRPVVITAPWGTPEETAQTYGIPKRRANELRKMVEDSLAKKGYLPSRNEEPTVYKNGGGNGAARSEASELSVRTNSKAKSKSGNASQRKTTRAKAKISR